jgi:template-activating factor I
MVANTSKKLKVSDKSDNNEKIDGELVSNKKLEEIQDELKKINEEATDKFFEIKHKYNEVSKPLYDKRNNLIKSIPNFWLTVFSNHHSLNLLLNVEDNEIFKHLSSLDVEYHKDVKWGYSITFNFNPNPYFENTKIVKYVTVLGEKKTKVTNTPIKWKEGKELILNENSPSDFSFFNWFSEPEKKGRMNEIHDKIADIIKDDLLLNPLDYFNNEDSDEAYEDDDENVSSDVEMDDDDSYDAEMDSDDSDDDDDDDEEYDDEDYI